MSTTQTVTVRLPAEMEARTRHLDKLLTRANREQPDPAALAELRAIYDEIPAVWRELSNMTAHIQADIITRVVGGAGSQEALARRVARMRDDLGYRDAPELERGLIEHVVTCWLRMTQIEWRYSQVMAESISFAKADYWERHLTATQRRYERACATLARVRRLSRPTALQVNIGGQQVNLATGSVGAPSGGST